MFNEPIRIYSLHEAPQWVRMGAYIAGIRKANVAIYETGYTYMPERLRAIVIPNDSNKRPLRLFSSDEDILAQLTWKQARRAKTKRKATTTDKTFGGKLPFVQLIWKTDIAANI